MGTGTLLDGTGSIQKSIPEISLISERGRLIPLGIRKEVVTMSESLNSLLKRLYEKYRLSNSTYPFLTWVQIQRTGTAYFDPIRQGTSGLEIDDLLFQHSLGTI